MWSDQAFNTATNVQQYSETEQVLALGVSQEKCLAGAIASYQNLPTNGDALVELEMEMSGKEIVGSELVASESIPNTVDSNQEAKAYLKGTCSSSDGEVTEEDASKEALSRIYGPR